VTANLNPIQVREQFKSWCTRKLKNLDMSRHATAQQNSAASRTQWWAERGSNRYLNDNESVEAAILYVRDAQDQGGSRASG
jgi:hypothetical protein